MLEVTALPLAELRERSSEKWREYPADVLPLFVAETDFPLAPAISSALRRAVDIGDTGYVASRTPLAATYADFALRRFGWHVDRSNPSIAFPYYITVILCCVLESSI